MPLTPPCDLDNVGRVACIHFSSLLEEPQVRLTEAIRLTQRTSWSNTFLFYFENTPLPQPCYSSKALEESREDGTCPAFGRFLLDITRVHYAILEIQKGTPA